MSGKRARFFRKNKKTTQRTLALCAGFLLATASLAAESDFTVSLYAPLSKPFGQTHGIEYGAGLGLKLNYRPVDFLNVFVQGEYLSMSLKGIDPIKVMDASLGGGYHLKVTDRASFDINASGGAFLARAMDKKLPGFTAGISLVFSYKLSPSVSLDSTLSGTHFASGSTPLMTVNAGFAPGISFDLTKAFNNQTKLSMEVDQLAPVFPALYSWYDNNSFGKITITNNEECDITDITVSFYQPQYMSHPKECMNIRKIEKGQSADVDLIAFFNEQMLELTEMTGTNSSVIVTYHRLGQKCTKTFAFEVPVYGRNNMSWDDDRRAAVFVSSKDPAAMHFAKYVTSIVREKKRPGVPVNVQYAMGIFEALDKFGINYVVDPSSAFADNVGTASIDFLQFPYQTLMYKGGDCDDLSILVCSLFEAVGIRTAFITVPGHIFMAFDSGLTVQEGKENLRNFDNYIVLEDQVWIPLEITLSNEGFYKAYKYGAREWNKAYAEGTAAIYRMKDSWEIYPPISVPGAGVKFSMPSSRQIAQTFDKSVDQWSFGELYDLLSLKPERYLAVNNSLYTNENTSEKDDTREAVLTEDPFAVESLYEVLALSGQAIASLPTSGFRVVEKKEDEKDKPSNEPEPEDEEYFDDEEEQDAEEEALIPVVAVNVPGPEELGIVVAVADSKPLAPLAAPAPSVEQSAEPVAAPSAEPSAEVAVETSVQAPVQVPVEQSAEETKTEETIITQASEEKENKKIPVAPIAAGAVSLTLGAAATGIYISKKKRV